MNVTFKPAPAFDGLHRACIKYKRVGNVLRCDKFREKGQKGFTKFPICPTKPRKLKGGTRSPGLIRQAPCLGPDGKVHFRRSRKHLKGRKAHRRAAKRTGMKLGKAAKACKGLKGGTFKRCVKAKVAGRAFKKGRGVAKKARRGHRKARKNTRKARRAAKKARKHTGKKTTFRAAQKRCKGLTKGKFKKCVKRNTKTAKGKKAHRRGRKGSRKSARRAKRSAKAQQAWNYKHSGD